MSAGARSAAGNGDGERWTEDDRFLIRVLGPLDDLSLSGWHWMGMPASDRKALLWAA